MAAPEKRGILTLMAEVVWGPKHDEKAVERSQNTIRPDFTIQRRVSTESLARIPRKLQDIIEDPQHMADFEAHLRELDIDIDKGMCGFLDCFHFVVRIDNVKVGDNLNQSPWTGWFPEDVRGHRGRGEYISKNFYFCTTPKNGPAQESSCAWYPDGNIFARLQKSAFLARLKALFLHNSKGNSLNLHDII